MHCNRFAFSIFGAAFFMLAACSSNVTPDPNTGGNGGHGGAETGGQAGGPPACEETANVVLAMDKLFLGDTHRDGTPDPTNGWKEYGLNIDGRASTKTSVDLCKPTAGGSVAAVYQDGNHGIDNSFGKNILPIMLGFASDLSTQLNHSIQDGEQTYLLAINKPQFTSQCTTSSTLFLGAALDTIPKFDGTDVWPIDPSCLLDPVDPLSAKWSFPDTQMVLHTVVTFSPTEINLVLRLNGIPIVLPIKQARVLVGLSTDRKSGTNGTLAGIMETSAVVDAFAKVMRSFDVSFCDPNSPTLQSILKQIAQASDILSDGTQDPSKECNAISIGIGFTMKSAQVGAVAPLPPPPINSCL